VVIAGISKSGLHNKPAGKSAAKAYASGPGSEEEEVMRNCSQKLVFPNTPILSVFPV
jgi:hypothetical protein